MIARGEGHLAVVTSLAGKFGKQNMTMKDLVAIIRYKKFRNLF